jgi:ribosome-associated protein
MPDTMEESPSREPAESKTRRKREMHALQELGVALTRLPPDKLAALALPERLADAIHEAQRLRGHEALRRQMQYIGRLMRVVEVAPIRAQLDAWRREDAAKTAQHHRLERWRDRLIADDAALTELVAAHPAADVQALRTLIRNARRETAQNGPPKSARALFRALRALFAQEGQTAKIDAAKIDHEA